MDIKRFRDEGKMLVDELKQIIVAHVEKQSGRQVHSVETHSDGRAGLGAVTIKFCFPDEVEVRKKVPVQLDRSMRELLHGLRDSLEYANQRPAPIDATGVLTGYGVRANWIKEIDRLLEDQV